MLVLLAGGGVSEMCVSTRRLSEITRDSAAGDARSAVQAGGQSLPKGHILMLMRTCT